jgi:hypothetical protein
MNLASFDAVNTMPSATSSERPSRPNGTCVARAALFSAVPVKRQHAGVRGPWRDGIHANSRLGDFERHRLGDAFDGVLSADVIRGESCTLVPVGRGDIDDAAAPLSLHDAHFMLHAQDHAQNVGLERRGKAFRGLVRDRADRTFGSGVVDGDIETPKPRDGLVDHIADVILLSNVRVDELGIRAESAQLLNERLDGLSRRPATTTIAPFLAKATAAARPILVWPPVIKTTGLSIALPLMKD